MSSISSNMAPVVPMWRRIPYRDGTIRFLLAIVSVAGGIGLWGLASLGANPLFLPSPLLTLNSAVELVQDGTWWSSIVASTFRILTGWGLGVAVGIPLGILMGHFRSVRQLLDHYIEFFRYVPPIAFVPLAVIWLGPDELSKIALIFYTTVFIVTINTMAGVQSTDEIRLRAARALGAGPLRTVLTVVVPSTVPFMVTGARLAMGNSFLTIVSAEIVAAQEGLGALIWTARNYGRTEWVFVGIITLGLLGYAFDRLVRYGTRRLLKRYRVSV